MTAIMYQPRYTGPHTFRVGQRVTVNGIRLGTVTKLGKRTTQGQPTYFVHVDGVERPELIEPFTHEELLDAIDLLPAEGAWSLRAKRREELTA